MILPMLILVWLCATSAPSAGPDARAATFDASAECSEAADNLRINQLQAVGSHNSYKIAIPAPELALIAQSSPEAARSLDYGHLPLARQLDLGMRQLELDIYHDPQGGRFAAPLLPRLSGAAFDATGLDAPGFKVLHIADVDPRSHCPTLAACLQEIEAWSDAHPDHAPILILLNTKEEAAPLPGAAAVLPFTAEAFDALDAEVRQVLDPGDFIEPDDVRGAAASLREAITQSGWPRLGESRGQLLLALDAGPGTVRAYLRGTASLEGLPLFVNSLAPDAPHAAYATMNDPLGQASAIAAAVRTGMIVRTRADADTSEARTGDTDRREAALASGAQFVSTDYYLPRPEWSDYQVRLPGTSAVRANPLIGGRACANAEPANR